MNKNPVKITVISEEGPKTIAADPGRDLLSVLRTNGYFVPAVCSGKGFCGKCKVRCGRGTPASDLDRRFLKEGQLLSGIRLACALEVYDGLTVYAEKEQDLSAGEEDEKVRPAGDEVYLAVDIGTTTVALRAVNPDGSLAGSAVFNNPQRSYGADVASRITAACGEKGEELTALIREEIKNQTDLLLEKYGINPGSVKKCAVACNTTMGHILMGYSCAGLGVYPFKPENLDPVSFKFNDIFTGSPVTAESVLLPGVSAYIGGDITAGIYETGMAQSEEISLLIDLGTNGETALGNKDKILTASAAAGPAFEGGNIVCGTGSVPGAVNSVVIAGGRALCSTVGGFPVCGICGTGVIDITAALVQNGIADKSGFLRDEYSEYGFPFSRDGRYRFTQEDVRQVQLAKAAVRAGIETLIERYGCEKEDIKNIYLSGGFSRGINIASAVIIGLLPEEFRGKTICSGNTALMGAVKYLLSPDGDENLAAIRELCREIQLADDGIFNEKFMDSMTF